MQHRVVDLKARKASRTLDVAFADGYAASLPFEYLRVFSPSAEVQGHGATEPVLVGGKRDVGLTAIEPVGRYAVRLVFTDGHASGLYSWDVLRDLADGQIRYWPVYEARLAAVGMSRDSAKVTLAGLGPARKSGL